MFDLIPRLQAAATLFGLACTLHCAFAQPAPDARPLDLFRLGAPSFTNFSARDGVPDSVIASVQTDRDGFVWLGSAHGVARYDGRRWSRFEPSLDGTLGDFMTDHEGTLWLAFRDSGIAHQDGASWRREDRASGTLPDDHVRRITETVDAAGHFDLWAPTFGGGLLHRESGRWVPAPANAQLPTAVLSVERTSKIGGHERVWAGTGNDGLWYREDGDWHRFRTDKFDPVQIEHLLTSERDGREELWISVFGEGLWRLDENGLHAWSVASGDLPTNEVYSLARSHGPDGHWTIWLATRAGLVRLHNDHVDVFDRRHGLPSNAIRGLSVWRSPDGVEVLWLATENGVARTIAGANQWQTISLLGARATGVFGVLPEADDNGGERLWVAATADGLGLFEDGRWRTFSQSNGALPDNDVRLIKRIPESDGTTSLWVGLRGGHLLRVRSGPTFEAVDTPWRRTPAEAVLDVLARQVDGHYERWFATRQSGLYRWRDGKWASFRPDDGGGPWRSTAITEQLDAHGRSWLWATSARGLMRFGEEKLALLGTEIGLPDLDLIGIDLYADKDGRQILWIGSAHHGIVRVDVTDPMHPVLVAKKLPAPPDPTAYSAKHDSTGRIYICTNNGMQLLTPAGDTGGDSFTSRVFARRDGMLHDECNTNAQFVDRHDRFWTGTLGGLTVFDPGRELHDRQAKPLKIVDLRIDDARVGDGSVSDGRVLVSPGERELYVEFALLSWRRENESAFRTQLIGYETAPNAWSTQNYRDFNELPPGDYSLRIEGRDYAGNISKAIDVAVTVAPAWWQRTISRIAFGAIAFVLLYALLQWRTRSLKTQQSRLAAQVATRTAELHVANARLLELSYHDALTGLANRRRLLETLDAIPVAHRGTSTALLLADVDHFKSYNDRFGHPAGDEALRRVAKAIRDSLPARALVARYGGEEFACLLSSADATQVLEMAERIRSEVENCAIQVPGGEETHPITISVGFASRTIESVADANHLLRDADVALYRAKHEGRNCVRG